MSKIDFFYRPKSGSFPCVDFLGHLLTHSAVEWCLHPMRSLPGFGVTPRNRALVSPSERTISSSKAVFRALKCFSDKTV